MEVDYNDRAADLGLVIASACGFDSIPADIGVRYTQLKFPGTLTAVESYMNARVGEQGNHVTTMQSMRLEM